MYFHIKFPRKNHCHRCEKNTKWFPWEYDYDLQIAGFPHCWWCWCIFTGGYHKHRIISLYSRDIPMIYPRYTHHITCFSEWNPHLSLWLRWAPVKPSTAQEVRERRSCLAYPSGWWYTYPLKNMSSSVGIMKFPIIYIYIWKNKIYVPNHQPDIICIYI